jgi:hypothetical protein
MQHPWVAIFILSCNFLFAVLPGILYFATNVRIVQQEDRSHPLTRELPNIRNVADWLALLFIIYPMIVSIWQIVAFHRLISLRMTRTFFFGQFISLVLYLMCYSKPLLRKFTIFPPKQTIPVLSVLLLLASYFLIFIPYLLTISEFHSYHGTSCRFQKQLKHKSHTLRKQNVHSVMGTRRTMDHDTRRR